MSEDNMRRIVYGLDADPAFPVIGALPNSADLGPNIYTLVGDGNPYLIFKDPDLAMEILTADEIGCNFNAGILASSDYQTNRLRSADMMDNPPPNGVDNDSVNVVWKVA